MHWLLTFVSVIAAAQAALASPWKLKTSYAVKETHIVPKGWNHIGIPDPNHIINLKIGLKNKNFKDLETQLFEISDPTHTRYGQHLSKHQVANLVRPDSYAQTLVDNWLQGHDIAPWQCRYSNGGDWISVSLPVKKVEKLLNTKYSVYEHSEGDLIVRTPEWSLPEHLHSHISTIQPTTAFLRASPKIQTVMEAPLAIDLDEMAKSTPPNGSSISQNCNFEGMTTSCLRALYGLSDYTPQSPQTHIGFTNYLGEVTNRSDTSEFLKIFRPEAVAAAQAFQQISINGGPIDNGTDGAGTEANLDVETITGLVWPINVTSYSTGGSPPFTPDLFTPTDTNEPYLTWLDYVLSQQDLPQVISTSYGDDEQTVPPSYAEAVCQGLAQLGARGISVIFSSGDSGVGDNSSCVSNDGKNTTQFLPAFPASCPYVTAVGATKQYPEIVATDSRNGFVSGSGFSNYFEQPKYQKDSGVVDKYIKALGGKNDGLYNKTGRAYPDVAAQGYRYLTIFNASVSPVDGTSCAAPTFSSVITLLNDALLEAGKKPLGFLNPWLYSGAGLQGFTDVVSGTSSGCKVEGFPAGKGWDAASGWGTPQFPALMSILGMTDSNGGYSNGTGPSTHWRNRSR